MTTASPKGPGPVPGISDDEDKVVFKTPVESSKNAPLGGSGTPVGPRSASLGTPAAPTPNSFKGQDVDGDQITAKTSSPASANAQWTFPSKPFGGNKDSDPSWVMPDQVRDNKKINDGSKEKHNANGVLAPPAEITEANQPHSRQSSAGDSSSFDSPAIPTPGHFKPMTTENPKGDFSANGAVLNGYGQQYGYDGVDMGFGGHPANGIPAHQMHAGMHPSAMSPLMGSISHGMHGPMPPFSPPIPRQMQHAPMSPDSQAPFGSRPEDYASYHNSLRGGANARQQNGTATYPTLNNQQGATNPAFAYGSPPSSGYNPALMSPTLASPTFMAGANPYSPIHAPTPFSPYAATQPMSAAFDMMAPLSPPPVNGVNRGPNQARGHGYSASQPPNMRDGNQGNVVRSTPGRQAQPRAQQPRPAPAAALNHGHSLSLPHGPYSPQLNGIPYGPMSPPPFPGYYPALGQHVPVHAISPELIQAMAGMAVAGSPPTAASQQAYNQSVQNAMGGLQQDPQVMALIQQGGGPSANNRKLGLYKTELCRSWEEKGSCKYGEKCQFAHGEAEQRRVERHPKYKTEICRTFWVSGSCPYGKRCCFIHTELPANAAAAAAGNGAQGEGQRANGASNGNQSERPVDGRARSMSTNSDPNDPPSSLLARISARAQANAPAAPPNTRSNDSTPSNSSGLNESAIAGAIARAYSAYGLPAGAASSHKVDITPPEPTPTQPLTQASTPGSMSGFSTRQNATPSNGHGLGGGHHRVSASVDFGRQGRNLGSDLAVGLGSGMGHTRNPSASSIVPTSSSYLPQLSRTPLSGQSSPFGATAENAARSVAVGSSILDHSPW